MSAEEAFGSPVNMYGRDWPRLLMKEYGTLETAVKTRRRETINALLNEAEIKGNDRFIILRNELMPEVRMRDVEEYLGTRVGASQALTLSLAKAAVSPDDAKEIIGKLQIIDADLLARILIGFVTIEPKKPADNPDDAPAKPEGEHPLT